MCAWVCTVIFVRTKIEISVKFGVMCLVVMCDEVRIRDQGMHYFKESHDKELHKHVCAPV